MNVKKFMIFFLILVCITIVCSYLYYKPKDMKLNEMQIECIEDKIAQDGNTYKDYKGKFNIESQAAIKIFRLEKKKDSIYRIYGYEADSSVIVYDDKYYELCGNTKPFIMDVVIPNLGGIYSNKVQFDDYPFGKEEEDVLDGLSKKDKYLMKLYSTKRLERSLTKKLRKATGAKKDKEWLIEIDEGKNTYKLFNENGYVKEEGELKELK